MKRMIPILGGAGFMIAFSSLAAAAPTAMTGMITDSMCGASHAKMIAAHKEAKMTDRDCTLACVKAGGKFVFVSDGKVYNISNQSLADLTKYAGQNVKLTGDVNGQSVTVSKIAASK